MSATEEFYARNRGPSSTANVRVNWPQGVTLSIEDHNPGSSLLVALLDIDGVRIRHSARDMRLLLRSALEQLDEAEVLDAQAAGARP